MTQSPPVAPPPLAGPDSRAQKNAGLGIAVAALVLGLCGFVPTLGLIAGPAGIVVAAIALARRSPGRGLAIGGLVCGGIGLVLNVALIGGLLLALSYAKGTARRAVCKANLHSIGLAVMLYAEDYDGMLPGTLEGDGGILAYLGEADGRESLKCPAARSGRSCDYFYFPPASSLEDVPRWASAITACDLKGNHGGKGRNVLFLDSHVAWLTEADFQSALADPANAEFAKALREAEGP